MRAQLEVQLIQAPATSTWLPSLEITSLGNARPMRLRQPGAATLSKNPTLDGTIHLSAKIRRSQTRPPSSSRMPQPQHGWWRVPPLFRVAQPPLLQRRSVSWELAHESHRSEHLDQANTPDTWTGRFLLR